MPTHTTIKHKFAPYIKKTLAEFNGLNIGQKGERGHDMSAKHGPEPSLNSLFTKPLENSPPLFLSFLLLSSSPILYYSRDTLWFY